MTGGPTCAWPNKYSNSGNPCPLQQPRAAPAAQGIANNSERRFKGCQWHDCNTTVQCEAHARAAPALTWAGGPRPYANHHVANGVEKPSKGRQEANWGAPGQGPGGRGRCKAHNTKQGAPHVVGVAHRSRSPPGPTQHAPAVLTTHVRWRRVIANKKWRWECTGVTALQGTRQR